MFTSVMRFVDTNILLYAISSSANEVEKARLASALLNEPDLALSVQVLQEFYVQATRVTRAAPLAHMTAISFITSLQRFPVQDTTLRLVHGALAAKAKWKLSYWDAAIVEAARAVGCDILFSEDLQHGQDFDGVRVINPFL